MAQREPRVAARRAQGRLAPARPGDERLARARRGGAADDWQFGIGGALPLRTGESNLGLDPNWNTDRTFSWALMANLNYYFR